MKKRSEFAEISTLVFKAIALAMAVAVVVLNILKAASPETQMLFLGFGLFCLALTNLDKETNHAKSSD